MDETINLNDILDDSFDVDDELDEILEWISENQDEVFTDNGECIKVMMDLPPISRVGADKLLLAITTILGRYNVAIPEAIKKEFEKNAQHEAVFLAPAPDPNLRPRTVSINTFADTRTLMIRGEPPIHGIDGKVEVFFDFHERPGEILPDGTIDFRNINKFPQVQKGETVVKIYEPTEGTKGTDVEGKPIFPIAGIEYDIEIGDGIEVKREFISDEDRYLRSYLAERSGVVISHFKKGKREPENLKKIEIRNKIAIRNVDFSTGNIGNEIEEIRCVADVTVNGDIRGSFAVLIDGDLDVKGAIEGRIVDVSGNLKASFIRSKAKIGGDIEVKTAMNSEIETNYSVLIEKEIIRTKVSCNTLKMIPRGAPTVLVGQCQISARIIIMERIEVRSAVDIELGNDLFKELDIILTNEDKIKKAISQLDNSLKDKAFIFLDKIKKITGALSGKTDNELDFLKTLGSKLLRGDIEANEAKSELERWGDIENGSNMPIANALFSLITTKTNQDKLKYQLQMVQKEKGNILEELSKMQLIMKGVLKGSGKIRLKCASEELTWQADPAKGATILNIRLSYDYKNGLQEIVV